MNIFLWFLQIVLALKFLSVVYTHALRPDPSKMQRGIQRLGRATRPLLVLISFVVALGGAGLVLPGATGIMVWLTPWAAALLALSMLVAVVLHAGCREKPSVVVGLILVVLAAFVAYGRWIIAPF